MKSYITTIGLEIHAELKTKSKMFCGCTNAPHAGAPNEFTCPVCLAHPGTLPTINKQAVNQVLQVGVAVNGELADYTEFDRKNYFYPDIPKGYQISQYAFPLVTGGELNGVAIERIHLEEDTARSQHDQGEGSLVDYNRASVPLMELVTKPVIHDPKTAGDFARELQLLLRTLGVSDANMEKGEMRVEVNVSVSDTEVLGTKVEVKNINSFKAAESAINVEVKRQIALLKKGEEVVQETRGWDENRDKTFPQRSKETAHDYRYFPDPDLPKLKLTEIPNFNKSRIEEDMPELPDNKRLKYKDLGLTSDQISTIITNQIVEKTFLAAAETRDFDPNFSKTVANYLTSDVLGYVQDSDKDVADLNIAHFSELMELVSDSKITSRVAKDMIPETVFGVVTPSVFAEENNLLQDNSTDSIKLIVEQVLADNPNQVAEFKAGKDTLLKYFVGQVMKVSRGSANPTLVEDIVTDLLK